MPDTAHPKRGIAESLHSTLPDTAGTRLVAFQKRNGRPEKWAKALSLFQKLEREFIEAHHGRAPDKREFLQYIEANLTDDGKLNPLFNTRAKREFTYEDIYAVMHHKVAGRNKGVPAHLRDNHKAGGDNGNFLVRDFLSYEFTDTQLLDNAANLMARIFPDYTDFLTYIKKYSAYNPETKSLDVPAIIDLRTPLSNMNYEPWGKALLEKGRAIFFYMRCAHLFETLPQNHQSKILLSRLNRPLFERIGDVDSLFGDEELMNEYGSLIIAQDLMHARNFKRECDAEFKGKRPPDKTINIPEMRLAGYRFDMPGCVFARVKYDDPRFFHLGRYTETCERLGGHWEATIKEAYVKRKSTFYAIFDAHNRILAHCYVRLDENMDIVFDGFESDRKRTQITEDIFYNLRTSIQNDYPRHSFKLGPSQSYRGMLVDAKTVHPEDMVRGHIKRVRPEDHFDAQAMMDKAGTAASAGFVSDDSGLLSEEAFKKLNVNSQIQPKAP